MMRFLKTIYHYFVLILNLTDVVVTMCAGNDGWQMEAVVLRPEILILNVAAYIWASFFRQPQIVTIDV